MWINIKSFAIYMYAVSELWHCDKIINQLVLDLHLSVTCLYHCKIPDKSEVNYCPCIGVLINLDQS